MRSSITRTTPSFLLVTFLSTVIAGCASPAAPPPAAPSVALSPAAAAGATSVTPARAPLPPAPYGTAERLGGMIDAYVSAFGKRWGEAYGFTGYVAVARDGVLVFGKGYGKTNRETGAAPDLETRFRIGSLTKQFTAVAVMQLVERGKLRVEDRIETFVPGLSPAVGGVTLHQLLTHTSGVASYTDDEALMSDRGTARTPAQVMATFKDKPLAFTPGEKFSYSNSNYFLLGLVIEKVSGKSYEAYLQENLFKPAGMLRSSTVDAPDAPNTATGYAIEAADVRVPAGPIDMSVPFAAGALRSTAKDLLAWDRALAGDKLLSAASKKRLFTADKEEYAYGFGVSREEGREVQSHGGGIDGFSSFFARVPDEELAVIALSNDGSFQAARIALPAMKMALTGKAIPPTEEREVAPMDRALAARVEGEYELSEASRKEVEGKLPPSILATVAGLSVTREGDRIFMKPSGQGRLELFRAPEGELFAKKAGIRLAVEGAEKSTGRPAAKPAPVAAVSILQGGLALRYVRKASSPAPATKK